MTIMRQLTNHHSILLIGLLLIIHFNAVAQDDTLTANPHSSVSKDERTLSTLPDKAYFKSCLTDARDIAVSPVRWNKYQWIAFSGLTVLTTLLYTQDANIQKVVQKNQAPFFNSVSTFGLEPLGSGLYTLPALVILYGAGTISKDDKARYTALKGAEAYLFGFISAQILKQLTHRHRPYQDDPPNPYLWDGPFQPISNSSFPSGHSTVVFAVATVVAISYAKTIWVPVVCYTLAGFTAASRVYQNDHWTTDVIVGSALGIAIGSTIINNQIKKIKFLPVSHTGLGIMLVYHF
jgi:membrane-associated phospholipid phosphatase